MANIKPTAASPSRKRQILTGLIISLVTIILFLGVLELVAFIWERNTAQDSQGWTLVGSRRMPLEPHGEENKLYYLLKPHATYNWEGVPVTINSRGLRTEEFELPKPDNTYRILNVGDSVVFGWEVNQEETYGKLLEQALNNQGDGVNYEVINAGVPGWNPAMERNFILQEGLNYDPDVILLGFTIVNDVYGAGPAVSEDPTLFDWLRDHTYTWPFLTTQIRFLLARQVGPEAIPVLNPPKKASSYFPLDEDSDVWDRLWQPILEIQEEARARDIEFILIAFPTAFQVNSAEHPDVPQRVLSRKAAESGIEFVDLTPTYDQVCNNEGKPGACEGYENLLFADVWMHPNSLGHQLAADVLLSKMKTP